MKINIPTTKEIDIRFVTIELPCRYDDEDIPFDAPMRNGDMWRASVDIDSGQIIKWPNASTLDLYMKVVDEGIYRLYDAEWVELASIADYVPHGLIPGDYGDYVQLQIDEFGVITNWKASPTFKEFFPDASED